MKTSVAVKKAPAQASPIESKLTAREAPAQATTSIATQLSHAATAGHRFALGDVYPRQELAGPDHQKTPAGDSGGPQPEALTTPGAQTDAAQTNTAGPVQMIKFKDLFKKKGLKASPKHIKGNPGGKPGKTTKASREVMEHAQAQIESGAAEATGEANKGNDWVFEVARKHRHRQGSPKTRKFNVHKGGGDGDTVGYYMQKGEPSESESSEEEE